MDEFIGRSGVFLPKLIIIDSNGKHIETTNRTKLPVIENMKKSSLLEYETYNGSMPLTNPTDIRDDLERLFSESKFTLDQKG